VSDHSTWVPDRVVRLQQLSAPALVGEGPTDEELLEAAAKALGYKSIPSDETCLTAEAAELLEFARAAIARWGHPAPPGPVVVPVAAVQSREPASVAPETNPTPADRMALALCSWRPVTCANPCSLCQAQSAAVAHEIASILRERYGSSATADWLDAVGTHPGNLP
jgi:hypothetical protein